jgi:hypothetical protein
MYTYAYLFTYTHMHMQMCMYMYIYMNARMQDCPVSGQSGTGMKKLMMPELFRIELSQRSPALLKLWMPECCCRREDVDDDVSTHIYVNKYFARTTLVLGAGCVTLVQRYSSQ